jgi:hypothetical protein
MAESDSKEVVTFLRALADFYEEHPNAPVVAGLEGDTLTVYAFLANGREKEILRSLGSFDKEFQGRFFIAKKVIGGKTLKFYFYRDSVCTSRVVGTRHVERQIEPEVYRPSRVIEAHDEDILEWDCAPVLAPDESDQLRLPYPETEESNIPS